MTALSGPPVTVAAITAGILGWLVVDEPVELGRHDLAATNDADSIDAASQRFSRNYPGPLVWYGRGRAWLAMPGDKPAPTPRGDWRPVPVGRVAATVTVTHCLPIRTEATWSEGESCIVVHGQLTNGARVFVRTPQFGHPGFKRDDITEQTVWQSWLPGRWALKVTDPTPVEAP